MIILPCYFKLFTPYWAEKKCTPLFECDIYLKHFFYSHMKFQFDQPSLQIFKLLIFGFSQ